MLGSSKQFASLVKIKDTEKLALCLNFGLARRKPRNVPASTDEIIFAAEKEAKNEIQLDNKKIILHKILDNDVEYILVSFLDSLDSSAVRHNLFKAIKNSSTIEKYYMEVDLDGSTYYEGPSVNRTFSSYEELVSNYKTEGSLIIEKLHRSKNRQEMMEPPKDALSLFDELRKKKEREDPINHIIRKFYGTRSEIGNVAEFDIKYINQAFEALSEITGCSFSEHTSLRYGTLLITGLHTPKQLDNSVESKEIKSSLSSLRSS